MHARDATKERHAAPGVIGAEAHAETVVHDLTEAADTAGMRRAGETLAVRALEDEAGAFLQGLVALQAAAQGEDRPPDGAGERKERPNEPRGTESFGERGQA